MQPWLEYASLVWSSVQVKDFEEVAAVQRQATKSVRGIAEPSYEASLKALKLPTLVFKRRHDDMIQISKYAHGLWCQSGKVTSIRTQHHKRTSIQNKESKVSPEDQITLREV